MYVHRRRRELKLDAEVAAREAARAARRRRRAEAAAAKRAAKEKAAQEKRDAEGWATRAPPPVRIARALAIRRASSRRANPLGAPHSLSPAILPPAAPSLQLTKRQLYIKSRVQELWREDRAQERLEAARERALAAAGCRGGDFYEQLATATEAVADDRWRRRRAAEAEAAAAELRRRVEAVRIREPVS